MTVMNSRLLFLFVGFCSAAAVPDHFFYRRGNVAEGDARSPCPALNTLANHGVLPRNGRSITPNMLTTSIQTVYNIDATFGWLLGHSTIPLVANLSATSINLDDLNLHDAIEHDASLSRNDFANGDNHSLQPNLLEAMLNDAPGGFITVESLARTRARREKDSLAKGAQALGVKASSLAYGEAALLLQAMGKGNGSVETLRAAKTDVKAWFGEEKLPTGYVKPVTAISLSSTSTLSSKIQSLAQSSKVG